ncbi:MAG: aspartate aminotransferase family protein [Bacteroidales bacterium]|nr:aspartate aminotransferase family protein [Bacteroidales bacterium]
MTHRELFYRHLAQTSSFPLALEIERAEGLYMHGVDRTSYLDLISGISVSALGHRHPAVVQAVREQLDKYMHLMVYGEFVQPPQTELAELLVSHLPDTLDNVYLTNSGSEAVEGALKVAKRYTGRTEIVSFRNAYHGSTQGALSVGGCERLKNAFRPLLPDIRHLNFGAEEELAQITESTACVIAETIQGEAGAKVPDASFMKALRQRCDEKGALLILDEIQAGMGRTGKLWAFQHFDVVPDLLCLAKGFGGGLPIGAFVGNKNVMQCLTDKPVLGHISTFGGNAVCAAAAKATLHTIIKERLWEKAAALETLFREKLRHHKIKNISGKRLLLAVEFEDFRENKRIIDKCIERGLLLDWFLFADHAMRIAPPLILDEKTAEKACAVIINTINEI